ncbi:aldehyde dehydrogenase family protein, partial [Streptomyces sp. GbtcB6]|uniref:aldehyde dehydrogenase family protein n=1 Tax=Streptomyces sp. GbtcB6 TaxID=2824751 RepID=UPI0027E55E38
MIYADADLERAVAASTGAIFFKQGESCTAGSRHFVERAVYDEVVGGIVEQAGRMRIGPGTDPETDLGPLVSQEQLDRVMAYIDSGRRDGARLVAGGTRVGER